MKRVDNSSLNGYLADIKMFLVLYTNIERKVEIYCFYKRALCLILDQNAAHTDANIPNVHTKQNHTYLHTFNSHYYRSNTSNHKCKICFAIWLCTAVREL